MDFFDLHCDTVSRLTEGGGIADADAHINLEKARALGRWAQVFAVFVQDNAPGADTAYASYRPSDRLFSGAARREQRAGSFSAAQRRRRKTHLKRAGARPFFPWKTVRRWVGTLSVWPNSSATACAF